MLQVVLGVRPLQGIQVNKVAVACLGIAVVNAFFLRVTKRIQRVFIGGCSVDADQGALQVQVSDRGVVADNPVLVIFRQLQREKPFLVLPRRVEPL